ncbi:MAG: Co2+/Mg2+ efflux protein ApaG [Aquimonas sp.]|nr:Co2+/Mg2+ efflux protein ApaG [Aquimonas sp.]
MSTTSPARIRIEIETRYLPEQSQPEAARYAFAYTVRMSHEGGAPARLLDRHWIITDADGHSEEVRGPGVVGQHPRLEPGESFQYTSGAVLRTPVGQMSGSYGWQTDDDEHFRSPIDGFVLSMPRVLH